MTVEKTAVAAVAGLMVLAARTAPKGKGIDTILIRALTDLERKKLATRLAKLGRERGIGFFLRDAKNLALADGCVLLGVQGDVPVGVNCGACGYENCAAMAAASRQMHKKATPFRSPNCAIRMTDLGIALGSAVKTAQIHNVDNRIMYSGGVAALDIGLMGKECTVAYAVPLSATGKNIFFDRDVVK
jgi:uncharacterized ferredoxin-like protein